MGLIIFTIIYYFRGKARIEDVVFVTSLGVLWIMIKLIAIQSIIEEIKNREKAKGNKQ